MANESFRFNIKAVNDTKTVFNEIGRDFDKMSSRFKALRDKQVFSPAEAQRMQQSSKTNVSRTAQGAISTATDMMSSGRPDLVVANKIKEWATKLQDSQNKPMQKSAKDVNENFKKTKLESDRILTSFRKMKELSMDLGNQQQALPPPGGSSGSMVPYGGSSGGRGPATMTQDGMGNILSVGGGGFGSGGSSGGGMMAMPQGGGRSSGGGGKALAGLAKMGTVGAVIAGVGAIYLGLDKVASAYGNEVMKQMPSLRKLNTNKPLGGYGFGNMSKEDMFALGVSPQMLAQVSGEYGGQVNGSTRRSFKSQPIIDSLQIAQAYGLDPSAMGKMTGTMERFGVSGKASDTMFTAVGAAEKTGMGGARMGEFMDSLSDAVMSGISSGMDVSNDTMLNSLAKVYSNPDQRGKAYAPGSLQAAMQMGKSASMMEGGPLEGMMFASTMKRLGPRATAMDAMKELQSNPQKARADLYDTLTTMMPKEQAMFIMGKAKAYGDVPWSKLSGVIDADKANIIDKDTSGLGRSLAGMRNQNMAPMTAQATTQEIAASMLKMNTLVDKVSTLLPDFLREMTGWINKGSPVKTDARHPQAHDKTISQDDFQ